MISADHEGDDNDEDHLDDDYFYLDVNGSD